MAVLRQSALRDGGRCCKEALLPSKSLMMHAMCCSPASQLVSAHFTKWKEKCDWNAGGNYIPSANLISGAGRRPFCNRWCVCVCGCVTALVLVGMLIGDRSAVQLRLCGLLLCTL